MPLDLHPSDITDLADTLSGLMMEKLGGSFISSVIPPETGAWLRELTKWGSFSYRFAMPLIDSHCLISDWKVNPDGSIELRLADSACNYFWQGTFRPAEART